MQRKKSLIDATFIGNAFFSYGAQAMAMLVGFANVTLVTRYAGVAVYGTLALLTALSAVLSNILTFRTNDAVVRFYGEGKASNKLEVARCSLWMGLLLDHVVGACLAGSLYFFAGTVATDLLKQPSAASAVQLYSLVLFAAFCRGTGYGLLIAREQFREANVLGLTEQVLKLLFVYVSLKMAGVLSLAAVIVATLAASTVTTLIVYWMPLREIVRLNSSVRVHRSTIAQYLRFSGSTFLSSTLKAGSQNIDNLVLGYLTNASNVGVYNLMKQFLNPIQMLSGPVGLQVYPRFVAALANRNTSAVDQTIVHGNLLLTRGAFALLFLIAPALMFYWYWINLPISPGLPVVFLLLALAAMLNQQLWWTRAFSLSTDPNLSVKGNLLATCLSLVLLYPTTMYGGVAGTAAGTVLCLTIVCLYWHRKLQAFRSDAKDNTHHDSLK